MRPSLGSAAVASNVVAMPKSAVRGCVLRCIEHLSHALELARIAAESPEPERAARYIIDTVGDLTADLRSLRAALRARPPG
jgi:hypothetical protein